MGMLGTVAIAMMVGDLRFHFTFEHLRGEHYHHGMRFSVLANFGPNEFSALVGQTTVLLFGVLSCVKGRKALLMSAAPLLANLYVVLYAYSRSGWLSLMAGVCVIGVVRKRIILVILVVLVLGYKFILPTSVVERIQMTTGESGELDHASAARVGVWGQALKTIAVNPIGVGFEGCRALGLGEAGARDTHNMYLKVALEWGLLGAVVYVYLYVLALRRGWLVYRYGETDFSKGFGLGFVCATVANMVGNVFDQHFGWFDVTGNWWLYWAGVEWLALHKAKGKSERGGWREEAEEESLEAKGTEPGPFGEDESTASD
jgi:O-antigen ligase